MSYPTILSVYQSAITAGDNNYPVVVVELEGSVISDLQSNIDFFTAVGQAVSGLFAISCAWGGWNYVNYPADIEGGSFTYGGSTGWKIIAKNSGGYTTTQELYVYYDDVPITSIYAATSYGNPELIPIIIFTENGKLLQSSTGGVNPNMSAYLRYADNAYDGGFASNGNILVAQITSNFYGIWRSGGPYSITFTDTKTDYDPEDLPVIGGKDPYDPGGNSDIGGGTGDFDGTSDPIDFPDMPTLSAVDTGFITLFKPSVADLQALANFMWNDLDVNNFTRIFNNIMDVILGISIVPVVPASGGVKQVSIGNIIATYIQMDTVASQYVEVDCGTLNVNEYWGAYLDYDPYTKAEIYLPYIGFRALKTDDIMNKPVHVKYHVDVLSGACCAYVKCGSSVIYEFIGQCAASIPITGGDWTNVINGILQMATAIGATIATQGAAAPFVAGQAINGATAINKPEIERSGGISGTGGMLGVQTPFIVLTRPRQCLPARQNAIEGYPSLITAQLGSLSGYTVVEKIELFDIGATREEYAEIEMLLAEGVIL